MKIRDLKKLHNELYYSVDVSECYSAKDIILLDRVTHELEDRGVTIHYLPKYN